jgi:hypothetical protein
MQSSCAWLQNSDNFERWQAWLPNEAGSIGESKMPCSKTELLTLIEAADPVPVAMAMLQTNPGCAMCVIPCRSKAGEQLGLYGGQCIYSCAHQNENACSELTGLSSMRPFIEKATLHDRDSLTRLLELADAEYAAGHLHAPAIPTP